MSFQLLMFVASLALARASLTNGGHSVDTVISSPYVSNGGQLIRTGSSYGYPLAPGRSFSSGLSGTVIVRGGYGCSYNSYNGRGLSVGVPNYSGPALSGYGTRSLSYSASPSYSSYSPAPILKSGGGYAAGFHGGFEGGYGNLQNYIQPHHSIGHASFTDISNEMNRTIENLTLDNCTITYMSE